MRHVNDNDEELAEKKLEQIFAVAAKQRCWFDGRKQHTYRPMLGFQRIISLQFEADL